MGPHFLIFPPSIPFVGGVAPDVHAGRSVVRRPAKDLLFSEGIGPQSAAARALRDIFSPPPSVSSVHAGHAGAETCNGSTTTAPFFFFFPSFPSFEPEHDVVDEGERWENPSPFFFSPALDVERRIKRDGTAARLLPFFFSPFPPVYSAGVERELARSRSW